MKQENEQKELHVNNADTLLTTNTGVRVSDTDNSLKAGERGPTLLEDFHFREKMTHFDHERIPERVVHARGSGAHGYFELFEDMSRYTSAGILRHTGKQTPVFVRFSTVVGFRGSADTVRDVRGFAVKFYTEEGNWDLVGNNMPVFFIQDSIKFPDLVHAAKPEPHNEMPQASAAHDSFWDFMSLTPESMHMLFWVLSDRGIPRSYQNMEGFGVHTFRLVNEQGESHFVKFHWKPVAGMASLVWDEAQKIAGKNPDYNRQQLWESIEEGNFPEYELGVQIIEEKDEFMFDFDILDATKLWPEELVPVRIIGKMTLNSNPDNFFAETEQVAFHPGHVVPGIDVTNDPLLQGRLFSYVDTQLLRLGGPNFQEIPINRPRMQVHNNQRDGFMRQTINQDRKNRANYYPNSLNNNSPRPATAAEGGYVHYQEKVEGHKIRKRSESFNDHYTQARLFYNSMTAPEQKHIAEAFNFELGKVEHLHIRERMVEHIAQVDVALAVQVAQEIGVEFDEASWKAKLKDTAHNVADKVASAVSSKKSVTDSPALSMEKNKKEHIKGRKVAVLLAEGFNHEAYQHLQQTLLANGAELEVVSTMLGVIKAADGQQVEAKKTFNTTASVLYDAVFVPGGKESVQKLLKLGKAVHFIEEAYLHHKPLAASGEGVDLFAECRLRDVALSDGSTQMDKGVVTARDTNWQDLTEAFRQAIGQHRFWERMVEAIPG
ncbi:catalase [Hymenobacter aerilatus]|uniref:Catalase n=1 Tax=Hymenobacter aerilatus TaxID=2932251 RepID=A0A8T9SZR8_9BACT|nr:catalase [Hymenobacter aerilatus]UOR07598.1 catalase [Hymenobacter aerilatus]